MPHEYEQKYTAFEAFLEERLGRDGMRPQQKENTARVARRVFYGVHYDLLFPDPIEHACPEDEDVVDDDTEIRTRFGRFGRFGLRIAVSDLEEGLDLVDAFARQDPKARLRYCIVAK